MKNFLHLCLSFVLVSVISLSTFGGHAHTGRDGAVFQCECADFPDDPQLENSEAAAESDATDTAGYEAALEVLLNVLNNMMSIL